MLNGGTMLINCCGQDKAFASAKPELAEMFPKYELRMLPPDHPIYHSCYELNVVHDPCPGPAWTRAPSRPLRRGCAG